jgi:hypothetical protein
VSGYVLVDAELLQRTLNALDVVADDWYGGQAAERDELRARLAEHRSDEWLARRVTYAVHAYLTTQESKDAVAGESINASVRWGEGFVRHLRRGVVVAIGERSMVPGFADVNAQLAPSGWALMLEVDEASGRLENMSFTPIDNTAPPEFAPAPDLIRPAQQLADMQGAPPQIAALVARLRRNAETCRAEMERADPYYKPELAANAAEWDEAANTLEGPQPVADPRNEPDVS